MAMKIRYPTILPDRIIDKIADPAERRQHMTQADADQKALTRLEREDHRQFIGWLERNEFAYAHNRTDKRSTTNLGVPDFIVGCRVGLALEFKRSKGGRLSTEQERWRKRHEARGGIYRIVYSYQEAVAAIVALEV